MNIRKNLCRMSVISVETRETGVPRADVVSITGPEYFPVYLAFMTPPPLPSTICNRLLSTSYFCRRLNIFVFFFSFFSYALTCWCQFVYCDCSLVCLFELHLPCCVVWKSCRLVDSFSNHYASFVTAYRHRCTLSQHPSPLGWIAIQINNCSVRMW